MKRKGQGSIVLLAVMSVAIIFVTIIGATFAYFSVNLQKTGTEKKVDIRSKALVVEFAHSNNIFYNHAIPGRPVWDEETKPTNILKFTLTSPTDMLARNAYDVYLNIEKNDFITDNMVYLVKENECFRKNKTGSDLGTIYFEDSKLYQDKDEEGNIIDEYTVGVIPGGYKGKLRITKDAILGGLGCVDEWEIEVWLHEMGVEQNEDQGRELRATIEIETSTIYPIKLEHDNGNNNQDNNGNNNHGDGENNGNHNGNNNENDKDNNGNHNGNDKDNNGNNNGNKEENNENKND